MKRNDHVTGPSFVCGPHWSLLPIWTLLMLERSYASQRSASSPGRGFILILRQVIESDLLEKAHGLLPSFKPSSSSYKKRSDRLAKLPGMWTHLISIDISLVGVWHCPLLHGPDFYSAQRKWHVSHCEKGDEVGVLDGVPALSLPRPVQESSHFHLLREIKVWTQ